MGTLLIREFLKYTENFWRTWRRVVEERFKRAVTGEGRGDGGAYGAGGAGVNLGVGGMETM
jgi:hypothetical protein